MLSYPAMEQAFVRQRGYIEMKKNIIISNLMGDQSGGKS